MKKNKNPCLLPSRTCESGIFAHTFTLGVSLALHCGVRAAIAPLGYKGSQIFFHILILNPLDLLVFPSVEDELSGDWTVAMRCLGTFLFVYQRTGMPALLSNRQNVLR